MADLAKRKALVVEALATTFNDRVCRAGFTTMVQPAAKTGTTFLAIIAQGKFQGVIAAHMYFRYLLRVLTVKLSRF